MTTYNIQLRLISGGLTEEEEATLRAQLTPAQRSYVDSILNPVPAPLNQAIDARQWELSKQRQYEESARETKRLSW